MAAWRDWFESVKACVVDSGNPLGEVRSVTRRGVKALTPGRDSISGYVVIRAKDMDEAVEIAGRCPIATSIRIYERESMPPLDSAGSTP